MENNKALKQAKNEYDKIVADEHERELIKLREKYILDYNTLKFESYEHGKRDGIEQGTQTGRKQEKIQIAKNMLKEKIDVSVIAKVTGLTAKEIEKLIKT